MTLLASPPDVLRWTNRTAGHGDCAVVALELACGVTYETALAAALTANLTVLGTGLTFKAMKQAAKLLGFEVKLRRGFNLEEDTGILAVKQPHVKDSDHAVYLWEGRILEPMSGREQLWLHAADYISHYHYKVLSLIVVKPVEKEFQSGS